MTSRLRIFLVLGVVMALPPGTISAGSYTWVDEKGNVTYSDRPPQPAESPATVSVGAAPLDLKTLDARPVAPLPEQELRKLLPPAVIPRSGPTRVDDLLELSGIRAQLVGLVRGLAKEMRPAPGNMSARDQASVDRVLSRSLRHETVYALLREAFIPQVDRTSLEATAAWLRSPLARRITALEIASSEPGTDRKVADYAAELKANRPSNRRLELIQRLDWATGASEISADLFVTVSRGVAQAISAAGPPERRLRPGQIDERVAEVRARISDPIRDAHITATLYAYRDLTDDELTTYVLFSSSDAGRWYNVAIHKALVSAVGRAIEQTTTELVRAVPVERWARAVQPAPKAVK